MNSMADYFEAKAIMQNAKLKHRAAKGLSEKFISKIELRLKTRLPQSYRKYLSDFGYLVVEGNEFYGEVEREEYGGGLPSFVWATENARKNSEVGANELVIKSSGYGPIFTIDCAKHDKNGECPVYLVSSHYDAETDTVVYTRKKEADSFAEFFKNEIKMIIDSHNEQLS